MSEPAVPAAPIPPAALELGVRRVAGALLSQSILAAQRDEVARLTAGWLREFSSEHTRRAYLRDLGRWLGWCAGHHLDPLSARRVDVAEYTAVLRAQPGPRSRGGTRAPASLARHLAAVSSWYTYLQHAELPVRNPVTLRRPRVDRHRSATIGLTDAEARALIRAADEDPYPASLRTRALIRLMVRVGLRVDEVCRLDVADYGHQRGHRTIRYTAKGDETMTRAMHPDVAAAIDTYLAARARAAGVSVGQLAGPLFATASDGRLDQPAVFRLVRRLARQAGIPAWAKLSPHSLRHAFATIYLDAGGDLRDLQDVMGHASPDTTRRYDRDRHNLDRDPTYLVGARTSIARPASDPESPQVDRPSVSGHSPHP